MDNILYYIRGYSGEGLTYSGSIALAQILYSAPFTYTLDANGKTVVENQGTGTDMVLSTGRAINLDPTQDLTIPIHNNGGANSYLTYYDFASNSLVTMDDTGTLKNVVKNGTFDLDVNSWEPYTTRNISSINGELNQDATPYIGCYQVLDIPIGSVCTIKMDNISDACRFNLINNSVPSSVYLNPNENSLVGAVEIVCQPTTVTPVCVYIRNTIDGIQKFDNVRVEYVANKLPVSSTYTFNNSKQNNILIHKTPWSALDKAKIEIDPNLIGKLAMSATGTISELDMGLDVDDNYYMCSEDSSTVYDSRDTRVQYGVNTVTYGDFSTGISGVATFYPSDIAFSWESQLRALTVTSTSGVGKYVYMMTTTQLIIGRRYLIEVDVIENNDNIRVELSTSTIYGSKEGTSYLDSGVGKISFTAIATATSSRVEMILSTGVQVGTSVVFDNVTVREVLFEYPKITNFTTSSRTTQEDTGVQTTAFNLDSAGVPIAYTYTELKAYGDGFITVPLDIPYTHTMTKDITKIEGDGTTATITYSDNTTEVIS